VARPLEGGVFTVTQIDGKPATGATMEFRGDRMSGKGGCNRYNAPVDVKGDGVFRLTGGVAMTMMACMPDAMETEQAFSAALEGIDRWVLRGDTLELSTKGKVRIRATRGP
jgi:heat shock protein HslJ